MKTIQQVIQKLEEVKPNGPYGAIIGPWLQLHPTRSTIGSSESTHFFYGNGQQQITLFEGWAQTARMVNLDKCPQMKNSHLRIVSVEMTHLNSTAAIGHYGCN